ncbi:MAG: DUF4920 domain-containing protein [Planctomycetota bacterium]|jgi:hypothetical protein
MSIRTLLAPTLALSTCLAVGLALTACQAPTAEPVAGWEVYGADIGSGTTVSLAELLTEPLAHDGKTVRLQETVTETCQSKGCWMTLGSGESLVRVKFKDYAFFVPLDTTGHTVLVEGVFQVREIPLDEARHYLEDAGRSEEAAALSGPQRGYELVATGVRVKAA